MRARTKLFYGWRVLAVTMALSYFAAVTAQLFTGAMLPHIEADTGWSRTSITLAVTLGGMAGGFLSPLFGRLADRYGPRSLSAIGIIVFVASLVVIGFSGSVHIALFYGGYIVARATSQNTMSGVVSRVTAVNWFRRMRGRALGITSMAVPFGAATLVPIAQLLIGAGLSWESVYHIFAVLILVMLLPLALIVLRRRPEDLGLLPDGRDPAEPEIEVRRRSDRKGGPELNWTLHQAWRTSAFWLLIGAAVVGVCANGAIGFHQFSYFKDQGISTAVAAVAFSSYALSGAIANGLWGFLIERMSERFIGAVTVAVAGSLCIFLLSVDTTLEAIAFSVLFGLAARGEGSIITAMEAEYFGRDSFGAISGFAAPFQQIALGLGPTIAAVGYDSTGKSYTLAFVVFAVMYVISAALIWLARRPKPLPEMLASSSL
jgi:MFS family permease